MFFKKKINFVEKIQKNLYHIYHKAKSTTVGENNISAPQKRQKSDAIKLLIFSNIANVILLPNCPL